MYSSRVSTVQVSISDCFRHFWPVVACMVDDDEKSKDEEENICNYERRRSHTNFRVKI